MSTRVYNRQTVRWERADIEALVEAGRAQYFPGLPGYVIDKKIPVRNHQIDEDIFAAAPKTEVYVPAITGPMNGYSAQERYDGEDVGPHGVVYENALRIATEYLAAIKDRATDPLVIVRSILEDEEGEYTNSLNETIWDIRHAAKKKATLTPAAAPLDEDALLAKFGV